MFKAGIVGASGYGGSELVRLLAGHPSIEATVIAAHAQAGSAVQEVFPNLAGDRTFDAIDVDRLAELDVVFLSTPHGPAIELGSALADAGVRTVDLSAAFRLSADEFTTWYGEPHPRHDLLPVAAAGDDEGNQARAVYGLAEFARARISGATLVANPGCYVITALLGLVPLSSLIAPNSLVVDGKSGTSGAGRATKDSLHFTHVDGAVTAYGAPGHRHTGEIERYLGEFGAALGPISFTPHLLPVARGLLITAYGELVDGATTDDVQSALHQAYHDEPFVHVLAPGTFPTTKAVLGSNGCQISATVDQRTNRVLVTSVTDNLGKGAAGGAIQNANLMLGIEETTGLTAIGVYP